MADFTTIGVGSSPNDGTGDTLRAAAQLINANWVLTPKLDYTKAYTAPQSFYPGTPSAPGICFAGDSNTGIFWYASDTLSFTTGGSNRLDITTTAINSALPYRSSATGSAGVPIYSFFGDTDTGVWSSAADTLSFAAGGVNLADLSGTALNVAVKIRNSAGGNAAAPDYSFFGDSDTGIYRIGADSLGIATGGTLRKTIDTSAETNTLVTLGPAGSASAPAFSFSGDSNTGIYNVGADQLGLTTGGTVRRTISTTAETVTLPQQGADGSAGTPQYGFSADTDTGLYRIGADILGFAAGGAERLRLSASGLSFDGGTSFYKPGAVQNFATAPVLKFGGGNTGMTYAVQVGKYVQIGPVVLFFVRINLTAKGSSTGNATVENLPLAAANVSDGHHFNTVSFTNMNSSGNASGANQQGAYIAPNTTTITLICTKNGSDTALTDADFTSTSWINVHGFYFV